MTFDIATLAMARAIVAFLGGVVLLMNWWHYRFVWGAFWWGVASCGTAVGIAILSMHDVLPSPISTLCGPLLLALFAAMGWVAARIFRNGSVSRRFLALATGGLIISLSLVDLVVRFPSAAALVSAGFYFAAAAEFWLGRGERLRGRWPLVGVLVLESIALLLAAMQYAVSRLSLPTVGWFGIIHVVGLVYAGGSAIFLTMMLNERREAQYKAAALTDPLTGLANRRAFMDQAQRLLEKAKGGDVSFSLIAFDLDRFKFINDSFGHAAGDRVLGIFADVLSKASRQTGIAARLGGEEFAVALLDCDVDAALVLARRIRIGFQEGAQFVDGQRIDATVSAGVTSARQGEGLAEIIARADVALYRAKDRGRNRVMLAEPNTRDPDKTSVIRIA